MLSGESAVCSLGVSSLNLLCLSDLLDFKCRHVLNSKESWASQDGAFNAEEFNQNIMGLFIKKEWAEETLVWWNE